MFGNQFIKKLRQALLPNSEEKQQPEQSSSSKSDGMTTKTDSADLSEEIQPEQSISSKSDEMTTKTDSADLSEDIKLLIFECIRSIRDPEKNYSLEELDVIYEEGIKVKKDNLSSVYYVEVEFKPTVPHCNLATLIGLCIRCKIEQIMSERYKIDIFVKKGSHMIEKDVNKQINDKERVAAALENEILRQTVDQCITEPDTH